MNNMRMYEVPENAMILAKDCYYDMDCYKTQLNNNVLVVGTSGAGKTRSIVTPNLLQATGNYIVSDPKGNLYNKYGSYLEEQGYRIYKLDFTDPSNSDHYNFLDAIETSQDMMKMAHTLMSPEKGGRDDKIWYDMGQVMVQACIAILFELAPEEDRNLKNLVDLLDGTEVKGDPERKKCKTDYLVDELRKISPDCYAIKQYDKFRLAAEKTYRSVQAVVNSRVGQFSTPEIFAMTGKSDIDFKKIATEKSAVFVVCSDTDRSVDYLVNLFYTQAMASLCKYADKECENYALPIPMRFIMDDFATNCKIEEFPRMISSIRSRNISTMLMIQAESQLTECFEEDGYTIIANCDTYIYMGGNDVNTALNVAQRADVPVKKVLNMPIGTNWVFRRGSAPVNGVNFDLESFLEIKRPQKYSLAV